MVGLGSIVYYVTLHVMVPPRCRNREHTEEIFNGTCPTVWCDLTTATVKGSLTFQGGSKDITKVEKLVKRSLTVSIRNSVETLTRKRGLVEHSSQDEPLKKKPCVDCKTLP